MFYIYYANLLETQKDILLHILQNDPTTDPFQQETILVQSLGMEQWLNWQIAEKTGIASNIAYPMPASFIWQLYADNLPNVEEQSLFKKENLIWRLMYLLPTFLAHPAFAPLRHYLTSHKDTEQKKRYQLAHQIAKLFDQYLVYRPHWITCWEANKDDEILQEILQMSGGKNHCHHAQIEQDITWQGILWRALIEDIQAETGLAYVQHRANLYHQFLQKLTHTPPKNLPPRLFLFGISALPKSHLETLQALSQYCDIHLFFTNGCKEYWGDVIDPKIWQKDQLRQRLRYLHTKRMEDFPTTPWVSAPQQHALECQAHQENHAGEALAMGNPLLASWGKMGRDFLYLLTDIASQDTYPTQEIDAYVDITEQTLLHQIQRQILHFTPSKAGNLSLKEGDHSLSIHACYSQMREVEALQDYLLHLFNENPQITPKDVIVMAGDIDQYTPYIEAVFAQSDPYIPFAISDNKLTENDVLIASFLQLLQLKQSQFTAEDVLAWLDIPMIRQRFAIELEDLEYIHHWVENSGIRFGLEKCKENTFKNYNAWQAGLARMLLGFSLREENGIWQDNLALDSTAGLQGQLVGKLTEFLHTLWDWHSKLCTPHHIDVWQRLLTDMITQFFDENQQTPIWLYLQDTITQLAENIRSGGLDEEIESNIIAQSLDERLQDEPNSYRFTLGKMNFCTLLPMRSIPFKVVCLLGMNDGDYPRIQMPNSFDLMQYHHQKGDRFRRDDDRYLFLEALLSAQAYFYISYIGNTITDDTPREPSVLVSQLVDYVAENLGVEADDLALVQYHSLNAFSAKNFCQFPLSFAKKWLPFALKNTERNGKHFIENLTSDDATPTIIELNDLINFVQDPVKYFFEKRLGVYFRQENVQIRDSENFVLDNLQNYTINQQLLSCPQDTFNDEWQKWQIKGVLPRGEFAEIIKTRTCKDLQAFRDILQQSLPQNADPLGESLAIRLDFPNQHIVLQGTVGNIFLQKDQRISYRFATLKGKDVIQSWINYLVLKAMEQETRRDFLPPLHIAKNTLFQLTHPVSSEQARQQLTVYVEAFIQGSQEVFLLPNDNLLDFLPNVMSDDLANHLNKSIKNKEDTDIYWQRIACQQNILESCSHIAQNVRKWWDLLAHCYGKEKKT